MVTSQKQDIPVIEPTRTTSTAILVGSQFPSVVSGRIHHPYMRIFRDAVDRRHVALGRRIGDPLAVG